MSSTKILVKESDLIQCNTSFPEGMTQPYELPDEKTDAHFMHAALTQARKAMQLGEVPIGAVIVCDGKIIGRGYNRRNTDHSTLAHAELRAIRKACRKINDWRLEGCTLYCTLEPCPMCAGAIVQARIDRVVIGTSSPKSGCGGTIMNLLQNNQFNHQAIVTTGVLQPECAALLRAFFKDLRARNKMKKKQLREAAEETDVQNEAVRNAPATDAETQTAERQLCRN